MGVIDNRGDIVGSGVDCDRSARGHGCVGQSQSEVLGAFDKYVVGDPKIDDQIRHRRTVRRSCISQRAGGGGVSYIRICVCRSDNRSIDRRIVAGVGRVVGQVQIDRNDFTRTELSRQRDSVLCRGSFIG